MVHSIQIEAALMEVAEDSHIVRWGQTMEISLDCFICERIGRTTFVELGADAGVCSGPRHRPHPAPLRIAAFDTTWARDEFRLRAVIDRWWAPFRDAKDDRHGSPLAGPAPWARLKIFYLCPQSNEQHEDFVQSNLRMPSAKGCEDCGERVGVFTEAPRIRLLA